MISCLTSLLTRYVDALRCCYETRAYPIVMLSAVSNCMSRRHRVTVINLNLQSVIQNIVFNIKTFWYCKGWVEGVEKRRKKGVIIIEWCGQWIALDTIYHWRLLLTSVYIPRFKQYAYFFYKQPSYKQAFKKKIAIVLSRFTITLWLEKAL